MTKPPVDLDYLRRLFEDEPGPVTPDTDELLKGHHVDQERRGLRPTSINTRDGILRRFADWLAPTPIVAAARANVEAWLDSLRIEPISRRAYLSHLRAFYQWAVEEELAPADPTARIRRPKEHQGLPRPITEADLARALDACDTSWQGARLRCFLVLEAYGGLRCCEVAGLHGEDVDRPGATIRVRNAKGGRERPVAAHPDVLAALDALPAPARGPVFTQWGQTGRAPLRAHNVSAAVNYHLRLLGIDATAHQLRHRFATRLYQGTGDLRLTQELLGHVNVRTTAVYVAADMTRAADAVAALTVAGSTS